MSRVLLLPSSELGPYQRKRVANLRALGPALRLDRWLAGRGTEIAAVPVAKQWMAFHPWRAGWVALAEADATRFKNGETPDGFAELDWVADGPLDLGGVCARAIIDFAALQNPWEIEQLLRRIAERRPKTIVEIGTSAGGLLFAMAQVADPTATLISIDIPDTRDPTEVRYAIPQLLPCMVQRTQSFVAIRESSTVHSVREDVRRILDGRSVDLLVIDGDHSYGAVRSDFEMYSPLVAPDGLVAFHDVLCSPENSGRGLDVAILWDELGKVYATETIADPDGVPGLGGQQHVAFEDRRAAALGWGLLVPSARR